MSYKSIALILLNLPWISSLQFIWAYSAYKIRVKRLYSGNLFQSSFRTIFSPVPPLFPGKAVKPVWLLSMVQAMERYDRRKYSLIFQLSSFPGEESHQPTMD